MATKVKKNTDRAVKIKTAKTFIGIDGEGQTAGRTANHMGDHRYVFLAAGTESGEHWHIENDQGLDTESCLDFLLHVVPSEDTLLFAYSFGYDLTKILADMPDEKLYSLFRPDERQQKVTRYGKEHTEPAPILWRGYTLNLQGSRFSVSRRDVRHGREIVLWDIFKFYQSKFVSALRDWVVGNEPNNPAKYVKHIPGRWACDVCGELKDITFSLSGIVKEGLSTACVTCSVKILPLWERMQLMKEFRGAFDRLPKEQVAKYCFEECTCMAQLARKLVRAHEDAGLVLKNFYGAGSSASAMLSAMNIKDQIRPAPPDMHQALARSFFGGRFENSVIGAIEGTVYNYDISSAYPYQITFLPCLMHGVWEHTRLRADIMNGRTAFVHYALGSAPTDPRYENWGPFPFRTGDGSICFPIESGGGWVGREEFLAGERLFPHVYFVEAWVYKCDCDCQPFKRIPEFYKQRIRLGKEGPGIVMKLGYNACYGKLAQSVGGATFSSWIWASLITSGTRAQILDFLGLHGDWSNLLMIATDGVYTRERIEAPLPRDTNTWEAIGPDGKIAKKPLGGWEEKKIDKGVFCARPGIYFPMNPTEKELKDVRGRGVGKGVVLENWRKIVDHWETYHLDPQPGYPFGMPCIVSNVVRFCGAKSSVSRSVRDVTADGAITWSYGRANGTGACAAGCAHAGCGHVPSYGQWIVRPVEMGFHPKPKRESLNRDGLTLKIRRFGMHQTSAAYKKAIVSQEAAELIAAKEELLEQPDADFADADLDEGVISL
jgi:hypothetical protein